MKRKLKGLSQRYQTALRRHLRQGPRASLQPAHEFGCQAAALDLETLDVARIHTAALAALEASSSGNGLIKRAEIFFAEAITPIEETHRAALNTSARLSQLNHTLGQRTVDVAAADRSLKQGIAQRKTVELALENSREHYKTLLEESLSLQNHLQHLAHRILSAQEDKRKKISHDLQDEIAQTLLGINVRLLTVEKAASRNARSLQKELTSTQRLVDKSVKTIERFAREYAKHDGP